MNTLFLLMARHEGIPVLPVEVVCKDYFSHLTPEKFIYKVTKGEIVIPLVRMESSTKCAKGVALADLAAYLDQRIAAARKECRQLNEPANDRGAPSRPRAGAA